MMKQIIVKIFGTIFILFGSMLLTVILIPVGLIVLGVTLGIGFFNAGMNLVYTES